MPFALIIGQAARLFPEEFYFWPMTYSLPGDEEKLQQAMNKTKTKEFFIVKPDEGSQVPGPSAANVERCQSSRAAPSARVPCLSHSPLHPSACLLAFAA